MSNQLKSSNTDVIINSMLSKIQDQEKQLAKANKRLAQQTCIIDGLELDLEHLIEQVAELKTPKHHITSDTQWISRSLPGIAQ